MEHQTNYSISRLNITLSGTEPIATAENFLPFAERGPADVNISFRSVPKLAIPAGKQVFRDEELAIYDCGGRFVRLYHLHGADREAELTRVYAAASYDWDSGRGLVEYAAEKQIRFGNSRGCFSHMGFEDILMSRDRLTLHASLIRTEVGGVLFSGVSGIGKSTQADLWHAYEGSPILNGDRPILSCTDGLWEAHGSPFAGSSRYYVNESVPIRAIVLLEQGKSCELRRLKGLEAFCGVYAGVTVNDWNRRYAERVCTLLEDLIGRVPVYRYRCTPDRAAVQTLKAELYQGGE